MRHITAPRSPHLKDMLTKELLSAGRCGFRATGRMEQTIKTDVRNVRCSGSRRIPKSVPGQKRKSQSTILMSALPPKAEVSLSRFDVRLAPMCGRLLHRHRDFR